MNKFYRKHIFRFISISAFLFCSLNSRAQTADFSFSSLSSKPLCDSVFIQFTDLSLGATTWDWQFSGPSVIPAVTQKNPIIQFQNCGTYSVTLTINGGASSKTLPVVIHCNPTACISPITTSGCAPVCVTFQSCSHTNPPGGNLQYLWDSNDGVKYTVPNPTHCYVGHVGQDCNTPILIVTDDNGCTDLFNDATTFVCSYLPPLFKIKTLDTNFACAPPYAMTFFDSIYPSQPGTGTYTYKWSVSPTSGVTPTTSTAASPKFTFLAGGTYSITCTVTDSKGCKSTSVLSNYIEIKDFKTVFTFTNDKICECDSIQFVNPDTIYSHKHIWSVTPPSGLTFKILPNGNIYNNGSNMQITFCKQGTYIVKDEKDINGCKVSSTSSIQVFPKPVVDFQVNGPNTFCKVPQSVTVTVLSPPIGAGYKYHWDFGGGVVTPASNVDLRDPGPITFSNCSNYDISLTVTNTNTLCASTKTIPDAVKISCPEAKYASITAPKPGQFCVPQMVKFDGAASVDAVTYCWNVFPVGSPDSNLCVSTQAQLNYNFTQSDCYRIKLIITNGKGCSDTTVNSGNPKPYNIGGANLCMGDSVIEPCWKVSPHVYCAKTTVTLSNCSTPTPYPKKGVTWCWNFGDTKGGLICQGTALTGTHVYADTGWFKPRLVACWNGCCDTTAKNIDSVYINPPIPKINVILDCKDPYCRIFTMTKSVRGKNMHWTWTFPDALPPNNFPVNDKDSVKVCWNKPVAPSYTKTITISLTEQEDTCENTTTYPITLRNLLADFTIDKTIDCNGSTFCFKNLSHGADRVKTTITRIQPPWPPSPPGPPICYPVYLGTGISDPPCFVACEPGIYQVELVATDGYNSCSDTIIKTITVKGSKPLFTMDPSSPIGCAPLTVHFTDSTISVSNPNNLKYLWDFGDPLSGIKNTSTLKSPTHIYNNNGTFRVKLVVTDNSHTPPCIDSIIYHDIIVRGAIVKFKALDTTVCLGSQVCFVDSTDGIGLKYDWDFGDGSPHSIAKNPCHIYTATKKSYTVTLSVNDPFGCVGTLTKKNYITVGQVTGDFVADTTHATCPNPPLRVTFTDLSNVDKACGKWRWSFGDGFFASVPNPFHLYTYAGDFDVSLIVTDTCLGCSDTIIKSKYIKIGGPRATPFADPDTGCAPLKVFFDLRPTTSQNFIWDFGDNSPNISGSNYDSITHIYADTGAHIVKVYLSDPNGNCFYWFTVDTIFVVEPHAKFKMSTHSICANSSVTFTDASYSLVGINKWKWYFGDGDSSSLQSPTYVYKKKGNFEVVLIATPPGACSDTARDSIHITASPVADFIVSDNSVCPNVPLQFTDKTVSESPIVYWYWTFNDASNSNLQNPSHTYPNPGTYVDTLFVTAENGCTDTAFKSIVVNPYPVADAGLDHPVCLGSVDTLLRGSGGVLYHWEPPSGSANQDSIVYLAIPAVNTTYTLTVTDVNGCTDDDTVIVTIKLPPHASVSYSDTTVCYGSPATLHGFGGSGNGGYLWAPGDATDSNFVVAPGTTTTYTLTVFDNLGCNDDTTIIVTVLPPPPVNPGSDTTICAFDSFHLKGSGGVSYQWSPSGSLDNSTLQNPLASPTITTTYTLLVTDVLSCQASASVTVYVNPLPIINAGPDIKICLGGAKQLSVNGAISYVWTPDINILHDSTSNPLIFGIDSMTYYIAGTDANTCVGKDSLKVEVLKPFTVDYCPDACICFGESTTLCANGSTANIYKWSGIEEPDAENCCPVVSPASNTTYTVVVTDELHCFVETGKIAICVHPAAKVEAGNRELILAGSSVQLNAKNLGTPGTGTFNWMPDSTLSCYNCPNPIASPLNTATYHVTLSDQYGCKNSDSVIVYVYCNENVLYIPNAFTPNGDGINDEYIVTGQGISKFQLSIYNRWGEEVFETNDLKQGWDGTVKGKKSEPEVFVYSLKATCSTGDAIIKKGNITLIR